MAETEAEKWVCGLRYSGGEGYPPTPVRVPPQRAFVVRVHSEEEQKCAMVYFAEKKHAKRFAKTFGWIDDYLLYNGPERVWNTDEEDRRKYHERFYFTNAAEVQIPGRHDLFVRDGHMFRTADIEGNRFPDE